MTIRRRLICMGLLISGLLLAADAPLDWLRRGNAAYERGDYAAAREAYGWAETKALDPGLVAFNRAAAHYQLAEFEDAELDYRRALEDAEGLRRIRSLYGLGNALARQGAERSGRAAVGKLLAAVRAYEECLAEEAPSEEAKREAAEITFADARHNLKLLEPLLARKRAEAATEPPPPPAHGSEPPGDQQTSNRGNQGESKPERGSPGNARPDPRGNNATASKGGTQPAAGTKPPALGRGNVPPLLNDKDAPPLDDAAARAALDAHLDRIRRERSERQGLPPARVRFVKDW